MSHNHCGIVPLSELSCKGPVDPKWYVVKDSRYFHELEIAWLTVQDEHVTELSLLYREGRK